MLDEIEKGIKIESFSGKQIDWQVRSEQSLSRTRRKGYKDILRGKEMVPSDSDFAKTDLTESEGKQMKKLRDLNDMAYGSFLLMIDGKSQSGKVAFKIVSGCKTDDLSNGDAALAWKRLSKKYEPKTAPSRLMLKKRFNSSVLKSARVSKCGYFSHHYDSMEQILCLDI